MLRLSNTTPLIVHAGFVAVPFWRGRLLRVNWHQQLNLLLDFWKNQKIFTTKDCLPLFSNALLVRDFFPLIPFVPNEATRFTVLLQRQIQWCYIKEKAPEASGLAKLCTWLFMKAGSTISFTQRGVSSFEVELTFTRWFLEQTTCRGTFQLLKGKIQQMVYGVTQLENKKSICYELLF